MDAVTHQQSYFPQKLAAVTAFGASLIPTVGAQECASEIGQQCLAAAGQCFNNEPSFLWTASAWVFTGITGGISALASGTFYAIIGIPAAILATAWAIIGIAWNILTFGFAIVCLGAFSIAVYAAYQAAQYSQEIAQRVAEAPQQVRNDVQAVRDGAAQIYQNARAEVQAARAEAVRVMDARPEVNYAVKASIVAYTALMGAATILVAIGIIKTIGTIIGGVCKLGYQIAKSVVQFIYNVCKSVFNIAMEIAALFGQIIKFGYEVACDGAKMTYEGGKAVGGAIRDLLKRDVKPITLEASPLRPLSAPSTLDV